MLNRSAARSSRAGGWPSSVSRGRSLCRSSACTNVKPKSAKKPSALARMGGDDQSAAAPASSCSSGRRRSNWKDRIARGTRNTRERATRGLNDQLEPDVRALGLLDRIKAIERGNVRRSGQPSTGTPSPETDAAAPPPAPAQRREPSWFLSRWLFLRLLGLIYLVAFLSLWVQIDGLVGHEASARGGFPQGCRSSSVPSVTGGCQRCAG